MDLPGHLILALIYAYRVSCRRFFGLMIEFAKKAYDIFICAESKGYKRIEKLAAMRFIERKRKI